MNTLTLLQLRSFLSQMRHHEDIAQYLYLIVSCRFLQYILVQIRSDFFCLFQALAIIWHSVSILCLDALTGMAYELKTKQLIAALELQEEHATVTKLSALGIAMQVTDFTSFWSLVLSF